MKTIKKLLDESLEKGWEMTKIISAGGLFSEPTYDNRIAYDRKQLVGLIENGFSLTESPGLIALNILMKVEDSE